MVEPLVIDVLEDVTAHKLVKLRHVPQHIR